MGQIPQDWTLIIALVLFTTSSVLSYGTFDVYWNIPSFMCKRYGFPITNATEEFGIIHNENDEFRGEHVSILYDPGYFPAILQNMTTREYFYRNGGVPQEGNIFEHLELFQQHVNELIPDEDYSGIAVIDFESWRPIYRQNFGTLQPYKDISVYIEQRRHPHWTEKRMEQEATRRFQKAGKDFMEQTIWLAQKLRPQAKWGYYAFPYCFNGRGSDLETCPANVQRENNNMQWLFDSADLILPSVYLTEAMPSNYRVPMVRGRIAEAFRLSKKLPRSARPEVLVYHRYVYTDTLQYLSEIDTFEVLNAIKQSGAHGVILWGSSNDLNTKAKCEVFYHYLVNTLGPVIHALQPIYSVHPIV